MRLGFLLAAVPVGLLLAADPPRESPAAPNGPGSKIVGYVVDVSQPNTILLTNEVVVPVDGNTRYGVRTGQGAREATFANVTVGTRVRITLGSNGVATRVTVLRRR